MGNKNPFYVSCLSSELQRRIENNPNYSLRAFAKFLNVDASFLSKVMLRKQSLSLKKAQQMLEKLPFSKSISDSFLISVADERKCSSLRKIDEDLTDCELDIEKE